MNWNLTYLIPVLGILLLSISVHEFSHALVAYRLGDPTAKYMGRLTLNPLRHLDPLGTMMILISALSGFGIGWGKPCPVNPWNLRPRGRVGMALVALGGPASNFFVALVLSLVLNVVPGLPRTLQGVLALAAYLNLGLTAFNLLPIPILDGFHILMGVVSSLRGRWAYDLGDWLARIEPHGPMILLLLVMAGSFMQPSLLSRLVGPVFDFLVRIVGLG